MAQEEGFVEIPGYTEVLRREREIRFNAFAPEDEMPRIGGIPVWPLTLRRLLLLERVRSAFTVPFRFDTGMEVTVEAMRFVWLVSRWYESPRGFFHRQQLRLRRWLLMRLLWKRDDVIEGIHDYLEEAFYDGPKPPPGAPPRRAFVYWMAELMDDFAESGFGFSEAEVLDMPLERVWQYHRMAEMRMRPDQPQVNPSDVWFGKRLAELQARKKEPQAAA